MNARSNSLCSVTGNRGGEAKNELLHPLDAVLEGWACADRLLPTLVAGNDAADRHLDHVSNLGLTR